MRRNLEVQGQVGRRWLSRPVGRCFGMAACLMAGLATGCFQQPPPPPPPAEVLAHHDLTQIREALTEPYAVPDQDVAALRLAFEQVLANGRSAAASTDSNVDSTGPAPADAGVSNAPVGDAEGSAALSRETLPTAEDAATSARGGFWTLRADVYENWAWGYAPLPTEARTDAGKFVTDLAKNERLVEELRNFVLKSSQGEPRVSKQRQTEVGALFFAMVVGGGDPEGDVTKSPGAALAKDLNALLVKPSKQQPFNWNQDWPSDPFPSVSEFLQGENHKSFAAAPTTVAEFVASVIDGLSVGVSADRTAVSPFRGEEDVRSFLANVGAMVIESGVTPDTRRFVAERAYAPQALLAIALHQLVVDEKNNRALAEALRAYKKRYVLEWSPSGDTWQSLAKSALTDRGRWDQAMWPVRVLTRISQEDVATSVASAKPQPRPSASGPRPGRGSVTRDQPGERSRAATTPRVGGTANPPQDATQPDAPGPVTVPEWAVKIAKTVVAGSNQTERREAVDGVADADALRFSIVPPDSSSPLLGVPTEAWNLRVETGPSVIANVPLRDAPELWKEIGSSLRSQRDSRIELLASAPDEVKDLLQIPKPGRWWWSSTAVERVQDPEVIESLRHLASDYGSLRREAATNAGVLTGPPTLMWSIPAAGDGDGAGFGPETVLPASSDLAKLSRQIEGASPWWLGRVEGVVVLGSGDLQVRWNSPLLGLVRVSVDLADVSQATSVAEAPPQDLTDRLAAALKKRVQSGLRAGEVEIHELGWLVFDSPVATQGAQGSENVDTEASNGAEVESSNIDVDIRGTTFGQLQLAGRAVLVLKDYPSRSAVEFIAFEKEGVPLLDLKLDVSGASGASRLPQLLGSLAKSDPITQLQVAWDRASITYDSSDKTIDLSPRAAFVRGADLELATLLSNLRSAMAKAASPSAQESVVDALREHIRAGTTLQLPLGSGRKETFKARIESATLETVEGSSGFSVEIVVSTALDGLSVAPGVRVELPLSLEFTSRATSGGTIWEPSSLLLPGPADWIARRGGSSWMLDQTGATDLFIAPLLDRLTWSMPVKTDAWESSAFWHELWRRSNTSDAASGPVEPLRWRMPVKIPVIDEQWDASITLGTNGLAVQGVDAEAIENITEALTELKDKVRSAIETGLDGALKRAQLALGLACVVIESPKVDVQTVDRRSDGGVAAEVAVSTTATIGGTSLPILWTAVVPWSWESGSTVAPSIRIDSSQLEAVAEQGWQEIRSRIRDGLVGRTSEGLVVSAVRWPDTNPCPSIDWAEMIPGGARRFVTSTALASASEGLQKLATDAGQMVRSAREARDKLSAEVKKETVEALAGLNDALAPICAIASLDLRDPTADGDAEASLVLVVRSTIEGDAEKELFRASWAGQTPEWSGLEEALASHVAKCVLNSELRSRVTDAVGQALAPVQQQVAGKAREGLSQLNDVLERMCAKAWIEDNDLVVRSTVEGDRKELARVAWSDGGIDVDTLTAQRALVEHAVSCVAETAIFANVRTEVLKPLKTAIEPLKKVADSMTNALNGVLGKVCLEAAVSGGVATIKWSKSASEKIDLFTARIDPSAPYGVSGLSRAATTTDEVLKDYVNQCLLGGMTLPDWVCAPSVEGGSLIGTIRIPNWVERECTCSASSNENCVTVTVSWPILSTDPPSVSVEGGLRWRTEVGPGSMKAEVDLELSLEGLGELALQRFGQTPDAEQAGQGIPIATARITPMIDRLGEVPPFEVGLQVKNQRIELSSEFDWKTALCAQVEKVLEKQVNARLSNMSFVGGTLKVESENCSAFKVSLQGASLAGVLTDVDAEVTCTLDGARIALAEWGVSGDAKLFSKVDVKGLSGGWGEDGWRIGATKIVLIDSAVEIRGVEIAVGDPFGVAGDLSAFGLPAGRGSIMVHRAKKRLELGAEFNMSVAKINGDLDVTLSGPVLDLQGGGEVSGISVGSGWVKLDQPRGIYGGGAEVPFLAATVEAGVLLMLKDPKDVRVSLAAEVDPARVEAVVDRGGVDVTAGAFGLNVTLVFPQLHKIDGEAIRNLFWNMFDPRKWLAGLMNISIPLKINLFASGPGGGSGGDGKNDFAPGDGESEWEFDLDGDQLIVHRRGMESAPFGPWQLELCATTTGTDRESGPGTADLQQVQGNPRRYGIAVLSDAPETLAPIDVERLVMVSASNPTEIWTLSKACDHGQGQHLEQARPSGAATGGSSERPSKIYATPVRPATAPVPPPGVGPRPLPPWPNTGGGGGERSYGGVLSPADDDSVSFSVYRRSNGKLVGTPEWTVSAPWNELFKGLRLKVTERDDADGVGLIFVRGEPVAPAGFEPIGEMPLDGEAPPNAIIIAVDVTDAAQEDASRRRLLLRASREANTIESIGVASGDNRFMLLWQIDDETIGNYALHIRDTSKPLSDDPIARVTGMDRGDEILSQLPVTGVAASSRVDGKEPHQFTVQFGTPTKGAMLYVPVGEGSMQIERLGDEAAND